MRIVHALEPLEKSIFLAGPTPRGDAVPSWRPEAVSILREIGFDGTVFVPEPSGLKWADHYDDQIVWEWEAIHQATVTVFWIPRNLESMPAFTTNVEFGLTVASSRVVMGRPVGAPKMGYLDALARRYGVPVLDGLRPLLETAVDKAAKPFR